MAYRKGEIGVKTVRENSKEKGKLVCNSVRNDKNNGRNNGSVMSIETANKRVMGTY